MKRRSFIKNTVSVGAGITTPPVLTACKSAGLSNLDSQDFAAKVIEPVNPDAPESLSDSTQKKVLVIGGGVAGLTASLKLAQRGYKVTIREAAPFLGGRLHTREEELSTGTFKVEHGLHQWHHQYYNFHDIFKDLELEDKIFKTFSESFYTFKNYSSESFKFESDNYYENLESQVSSSSNMSSLSVNETFKGLHDVFFYHHRTNFKKFENFNFGEWASSTSINETFLNVAVSPLLNNAFASADTISAAEMLLNLHTNYIGHPNAPVFKVTSINHEDAIIDPWKSKLESLGVEIQLNSPVPGLNFGYAKCKGSKDDSQEYDFVLLATDVTGVQSIFGKSKAIGRKTSAAFKKLSKKFEGLKTGSPYQIMRVWLDKPLASKLTPSQSIINTPEHKPISKIAVYDMLEEESKKWAEETGGSIIEIHMSYTKSLLGLSPKNLWDNLQDLIHDAFSQTDAKDLVKEARVLDISMGSYSNFTSYESGQFEHRPEPELALKEGISNILFAGDWVKYNELPCTLMERSVTTALSAVNTILFMDGVRQIPIKGASASGTRHFPQF